MPQTHPLERAAAALDKLEKELALRKTRTEKLLDRVIAAEAENRRLKFWARMDRRVILALSLILLCASAMLTTQH